MKEDHFIEPFSGGFIVADSSGKRGKFGEAYAGKDGKWKDQPSQVGAPFSTREEAVKWDMEAQE